MLPPPFDSPTRWLTPWHPAIRSKIYPNIYNPQLYPDVVAPTVVTSNSTLPVVIPHHPIYPTVVAPSPYPLIAYSRGGTVAVNEDEANSPAKAAPKK